ncbi:MAG: cation diffusion facilitator family transporter [Anaeromyxobacteraceae bacterium]
MSTPAPGPGPVHVPRPSLARFAWLSIAAAVVTIALKTAAWLLTGSVGLLSDAAESVVNLVAAVTTLGMLTVAARPPDEEHAYGHDKAEYFASGVEGGLIIVAAVAIAWSAVNRLLHPAPIEQLGIGLAVSTGASLVNLAVARILFAAGRKHHSIALEADAHHLMTDVWTSAAVLTGIGVVALTGWERLDPIVAIGVAVNITWAGVKLIRRSALGLLDTALPPAEQSAVQAVLEAHRGPEVQFHALRTRQAASRRFVSVHVLVPGSWTVARGHALLEAIERGIREAVPRVAVFTHLEALEDPASYADEGLDRVTATAPEPTAGQ